MIEIQLTQGQTAIIDDIDADLLDFKWQSLWNSDTEQFYAKRDIRILGIRRVILLHRVILERIINRPLTFQDKVDHVSHNTLDNRRSEIRLATNAENAYNSRIRKDNTSGYKGVAWHEKANKFVAYITIDKKRKHLGCFNLASEAALAYNNAAIENFGEFAYLNEVTE